MSRASDEKTPGGLSEKTTPPAPNKKGFFGRKTRAVDTKGAVTGGGGAAIAMVDDVAEQNAEVARAQDGKPVEDGPPTVKPVALLALFRYSTKGERLLMIAGLVASCACCSLARPLARSPPPFPRCLESC